MKRYSNYASDELKHAALRGMKIGRPPGEENPETFLGKPKSLAAISALQLGLSVRQAAVFAQVSVNTVQKVKRLLQTRLISDDK